MVGILVSLPLGYFLDQATGGAVVLKALSFAFALAAVMGVTDFLFFLPVPELHRPHPNPNVNLWQLVRTPLQDRNFRRFLGFTATMAFATAYVGQFATLYVLDVVGATNLQTQLMLQCGPLCVLMLMYPIWGRLVDRFGRKPVLLISGTLIVPGSVAWIFVSHDHWVVGYAAVLLVTAAWPGIEIANFNLLLGLADATPGKSGGYVAVNSALNAVAGVLSGLFGGAVAQTMAHWHGTLLGWPLTYHGVLFIISGGLRLLALVWLVDLEDPRAATTRVALRYLGTNLYSNLQQAIYLPARLWSQFSRWTYPANRRR
jgi:MFS family permease